MAFNQLNAASPVQSVQSDDLAPIHLSEFELDIAMDAIAQLIPLLDLEDCHKVAELAQAQATLLEIMNSQQSITPAAIQRHFVA